MKANIVCIFSYIYIYTATVPEMNVIINGKENVIDNWFKSYVPEQDI